MDVLIISSYLSIAYAILMVLGYIPGIQGLVKSDDVEGVSDNFWFLITTTVGISLYNLIMSTITGSQLLSIGANLLLAIVSLLLYNSKKRGVTGIFWSLLFLTSLYCVLQLIGYKPHITQTIAHVTLILAYTGQIYKLYATKSTDGLNANLFLIMGAGLGCIIISLLLSHAPFSVVLTEIINFVLILVCYLKIKQLERG